VNSDLTKLRKELQGRVDQRTQQLGAGNAKNFEEYKTITGQISGLNSAITIINDLLKTRKTDGEE
jgi:hypothetical protein